MKNLNLVIIGMLLFSVNAFGARYHILGDDEKFENGILNEIMETAHPAFFHGWFGNCGGSQRIKVDYKRPEEPWGNTVKQILYAGGYVEDVTAERHVIEDSWDAYKAVKNLVWGGLDEDLHADHGQIAVDTYNELQRKVYVAETYYNVETYTGGVIGAFDGNIGHVSLVDENAMEILVLSEGYCE